MAFALMSLPYADDALEPAVSANTLSFHHGKHHQAYIDKMNAAIDGTDHANAAMEDIVAAARGSNQGLFNNAAQSWNHGFYWHSMAASETAPSADLAAKIDEAFGSMDELKEQLKARGLGHFASGWVWLAEKDGKLSIEET
ncbi:MAG: superoxide dismutase, partial [Marinomonas sp.]